MTCPPASHACLLHVSRVEVRLPYPQADWAHLLCKASWRFSWRRATAPCVLMLICAWVTCFESTHAGRAEGSAGGGRLLLLLLFSPCENTWWACSAPMYSFFSLCRSSWRINWRRLSTTSLARRTAWRRHQISFFFHIDSHATFPLQKELADQLAAAGYCFACSPDGLAATLRGLDASALEPYQPGSPAGIAAGIDRVMGFLD